ncbi:MAG TPA: hypothetical protein VGB96_07365 [Archangium sp.]
MYFFPDRLLVSSPRGMGAIPYDELQVKVESRRFIESDPAPPDAMEVGATWQYVNRDGSPDRRFANNRRLPVLLYEQVSFTSASGLNEVLQLSRTGGGESFRSAISALARIARVRKMAPEPPQPRPVTVATPQALEPGASAVVLPHGRFEGEVNGDVDSQLQGRAVFGAQDNAKGDRIFYIVLRHQGREADGEHSLTLSNRLPGLPAPGTYTFGDMGPRSFVAGYSHETPGGASGMYSPVEGGTLEIEQVTEGQVRGTVSFRAHGHNTYNLWAVEGHVRLRARFAAEWIEGDPYELSRLPGEIRATSEVDDEDEFALLDSTADDEVDLDSFALGVIGHIVLGVALPSVLDVFAAAGVHESEVRHAEALIFAAFPIDTLIQVGHLGAKGEEVRSAIRRAVAVHTALLAGISADAMLGLVEARFNEYAETTFEADLLTVREDGMTDLAERAYHRIVGGDTDDYDLLVSLFTHFATFSETWEYGARLAELFDEYELHGNTMWGEE